MNQLENYPFVIFPEFYDERKPINIEKHHVPRNSGTYMPIKGITENMLVALLSKNPNFIIDNSTRFYHGKKLDAAYNRFTKTGVNIKYVEDKEDCYYPDILVIDKESQLVFDIEIDEPYVGRNGMPTHCLTDNEFNPERERNRYFTERGIVVIRFAEEQIVKHIDACVEVINSLVDQYINSTSNSFIFPENTWKKEMFVERWTIDEAESMANRNHRGSYLLLDFVPQPLEEEIETKEEIEAKQKKLKVKNRRLVWLDAKKQLNEYSGKDNVVIQKLNYQELKAYLEYGNEINLNT
jgi:hypothetical protein